LRRSDSPMFIANSPPFYLYPSQDSSRSDEVAQTLSEIIATLKFREVSV
jgi:hypothetical protein